MDRQFMPNCVDMSILCASAAQRAGHRCLIAVSHLKDGVDHAQAVAEIDGEWVHLTPLWDQEKGLVVKTWPRHFDREHYRFVELEDWIKEQEPYRRVP